LTWAPFIQFDLKAYPKVQEYVSRIAAVDAVKNVNALIANKPATLF